MKINRHIFNIVRVAFFILAPLVVAGVIYILVSTVPEIEKNEAAVKSKMERLRASGQVYYSRLQFYDGVCDDIDPPRGFRCTERTNAYVVETKLENGEYYCIDSTGFSGRVPWSVGESKLACK